MGIVKLLLSTVLVSGLVFFICSRAEAPVKAQEPVVLNNDSISLLLQSLHAREKASILDTLFSNRVKRTGFNGCVLVAQRGQVIYERAFGFSDLGKKDSLQINSAFQLASASKTLTAAAILILRDREKLSLEDDVRKYLPDFPYSGITIRMLLSHRSGLFNYIYACEPFCDKPNTYNNGVFDNKAMLDIIVEKKPAVYAAPDKKFEYCNTNYALLPLIVEKVTGQSFASYMKSAIFDPLGMEDTWVHVAGVEERSNRVIGHMSNGKYEEEKYADDVVGDKGIYSTVKDLLKWDQALYSDKLLRKETLEEAFKGYSNEHKGKRNYGLGWRIVDDGKSKVIYHNGWWHGFNSLFFRRPADQTTIILLSNKHNRSTYQIADVLAVLNETGSQLSFEGED
jgi:CubicO group peptidase (beta-lactamase class C family)